MRMTLSLDDVVKLLRRELRRCGASLKTAINHFHRLLMASAKHAAKPFSVRPRPLGLPPGLSYDNVEDLIEALEGPLHR